MTTWFLKAKHWQLFLLFFGLPVVAQIIFMGFVLGNIRHQPEPEAMVSFMMNYMAYFIVLGVISTGSQFWWQWAIAVGLQNKVPDEIKMKVGKFKVFFWIPMIYFIIFSFVFISILHQMIDYPSEPELGLMGGIFVIVFPLHLFAMICIFYIMYFVAKTIKTVELQKETKIGDFIGEFFLVWFNPIGVWFIQPKVNSWVEE